jgi:microcystin-dependent protein
VYFPQGWVLGIEQLLPINQNQALSSQLART